MSENNLFRIGITHGDYNGIGYEVIMKALNDPKMLELCSPVVYGAAKAASFYKNLFNLQDFSMQVCRKVEQINKSKNYLVNIFEQEVKVEPGTLSKEAGRLSELALTNACKDLKSQLIDAIVTAPICKANIQSDSFRFNGHTEFFAKQFSSQEAMMMMVTEGCRIAFATNHLPIEEVSKVLSADLIVKKLRTLQQTLKVDFACTNPTIAVLSLNPHAGDNGLIGKEDQEIIAPAIQQAFNEKINAFGPFPADGLFGSGNYTKFDAILAMYHDQGMIPFKMISAGEGVNFTAGLPIVRTSPAHGTAFDIAGKNVAQCESMRNAIYLAIDILKNRKEYQQYAKK